MTQPENTQITTLAGGCFWCLDAIYGELDGVKEVVSGYSGGPKTNPSYEEVCTGTTGHAEVVQITFDPVSITFTELLRVFFTIHDPTTINRQGADSGTQYRSAIFYHDEEQQRVAEKVMKEVTEAGLWRDPIVTEVTLLENFYRGEDYHQKYFLKNPYQPYCQVIIEPKLTKFRNAFSSKLKTQSD